MSEDLLTKSLGVRWQELAAMVQAYLANNITESRLEPAARAKLNRAGATAANVAAAVAAMSTAEKSEVLAALDAYSKPGGGIPDSDLTAAVRALLDKAGTAVQPGDIPLEANASNLVRSITGREHRGVTFIGNGASCDCIGSATDYDATCTIFNTTGSLPLGFEPGRELALDFSAVSRIPTNKIKLVVNFRGAASSHTYPANTTTTLSIPSGATGINMYLLVSNGDEVDATCTLTIMNAKSNRELEDDMAELAANIATLGASVQAARQSVDGLNARNACNQIQVPAEGSTTYGVTFAPVDGTERIAYSGTATGTAKFNLIDSQEVLPEGFEAGKVSHITFLADEAANTDAIKLRVEQYRSGGYSTSTYDPNTEGGIDIAVNSNTIGIVAYLYVANGAHVDGSCIVEMLNTRTNQELASEVDALRAAQSAADGQMQQIVEVTNNLFDRNKVVIGKNYAGSSAAYRAMHGPFPVGESISVRTVKIPDNAQFKVLFTVGDQLGSDQVAGRISNQWKTSENASTSAFPGTYVWIEWDFPTTHTVVMEDFDGTEIMISEGLDPAPYVEPVSAVDQVARRVLQPAYYEFPIGFTNAGAGNGSNEVADPPFEDADRLVRAAINQVGPAILGFTEARKTYLNGNDLYVDILDPIYPWRVSTNDNSYTESGIASRFPILSSGVGYMSDVYASGYTGRKYTWANINVCGHLIYVMCAHLTGDWEFTVRGKPGEHPYSRRIEIEDICTIFSDLVAAGKSGILLTDGNFNGDQVNPSVEYELDFFTQAGLVVPNGVYMPWWGVSKIDHIMLTPDLMFHSLGEKVASSAYASDHPFLGGVVGIRRE